MKKAKREEFSIEKQIGSFGLKSKIKLGFIPNLQWSLLSSHLPYIPTGSSGDPREFYLVLELRCPADIEEWKGKGFTPKSYISFNWGEKGEARYWFRGEPTELKKLIRGCPTLSKCCKPHRLKSVLKELKMKAFWSKVVGENG